MDTHRTASGPTRRTVIAGLAAALLAAPAAAQQQVNLSGVWRAQEANGTVTETALMESGQYRSQSTHPSGVQTFFWGNWRVAAPNVIVLSVAGYEPREFCGPLGCTPIRHLDRYTVNFRMLNSDTMQTDTGIARRVR